MKIIDLRNPTIPTSPANWPGWIYPDAVDDTTVPDHIKAHPLDDYRLEAVVLPTAESPDGMIVGHREFGIAYTADGSLLQLINAATTVSGSDSVWSVAGAEINREYRVALERRAGTMRIELDGAAVRQHTGAANADLSGWTEAMSRQTGVVRSCRWTNLTRGEVVFNYPESESVKANLLFRTGTKIVDGGFERANAAVPMLLSSNLDLRGYSGDLTLWADVRIDPAQQGTGVVRSYGLLGHGTFLGAAAAAVFTLAIQTSSSGNWYLLGQVANGTTSVGQTANAATIISRNEAVGRHRYALTLDRAANQLDAYIDGVLKWSQTLPANFGPLNPGTNALYPADSSRCAYIGNASGDASGYRIYSAMIFGRALQADEIRSMSQG